MIPLFFFQVTTNCQNSKSERKHHGIKNHFNTLKYFNLKIIRIFYKQDFERSGNSTFFKLFKTSLINSSQRKICFDVNFRISFFDIFTYNSTSGNRELENDIFKKL